MKPTAPTVFNRSGGADRFGIRFRSTGQQAGERALGIPLAGEHADDVAGARGGRPARCNAGAEDDDLTRRIPDELVIRKFHDLPLEIRNCEFTRTRRCRLWPSYS